MEWKQHSRFHHHLVVLRWSKMYSIWRESSTDGFTVVKYCLVLLCKTLRERFYYLIVVQMKHCRPQLVRWEEIAVGVPFPPLFSPLLLLIFFLHQLCMNISSGGIGLQQQDGVEIQLHHLSHPLSSFHPSIPHTFHVVIEFGWLPVAWITFPPGSLFSLSAGRISHSLSIIFFLTCPFTLFLSSSLSKPPCSSLVPYLYFCFSLPHFLSLFCAQEV